MKEGTSDYIRGRLLNETFKVITEDTFAKNYPRELDSIVALMRRIGVLYNEAVKTLNSYRSIYWLIYRSWFV